jgi:CRP-like cAMP-binding protein
MIVIMSDPILMLFEGGRTVVLTRNKTLFDAGERVQFMYLVTAGQIDLSRRTKAGARMILQRSQTGQVPAEASAYSETYHCNGMAGEAAQLRAIPVAEFRKRLDQAPALSRAWSARLAHALQGARMNAEIRTLRTVADRVDAWLGVEQQLPPKGRWQNLAQVLGVTQEALYRELAKRR